MCTLQIQIAVNVDMISSIMMAINWEVSIDSRCNLFNEGNPSYPPQSQGGSFGGGS